MLNGTQNDWSLKLLVNNVTTCWLALACRIEVTPPLVFIARLRWSAEGRKNTAWLLALR